MLPPADCALPSRYRGTLTLSKPEILVKRIVRKIAYKHKVCEYQFYRSPSDGTLSRMGRKSIHKAQSKHEAFARQYVILKCDGTAAARAVGYAPKSAEVTASQLLRNPKVKGLISALLAREVKKLDISVEKVLSQIARHAFVEPRALFNEDGSFKRMSEIDANTAACISAVEQSGKRTKRVKLTDQLRALEMLAKYHKLFAEDRTPIDMGVKVIVLDMPRPMRQVGAGAAALPSSNGHNGNGHNGNGNGSGPHE